MKRLILIASLFIVVTGHAQTKAVKDAQGNYKIISTRDTSNKPTGKTITDKDGKVHPLFISSRGKMYWMRTSKNGNVYRSYIKVDQN